MTLETGQVLHDRYLIQARLAEGGFGAVYRGWDRRLERACAIKENLLEGLSSQRQFEREARILAHLKHPNLPNVSDYFIIEGQGQYLVMEFIEGSDLQELLQEAGGPLPGRQVLSWMVQVCQALEYLHAQEPPIIHRDIKPANIKITPDGRAVLVDFGIAKVYNRAATTTLGAQAATPGYAPPEQYEGATDARSDVYSLGATLYALLTGSPPSKSTEIASRIKPPPPPADLLNPQVPPRVSAVIARAMDIAWDRRYTSVAELRQALEAAWSVPLPRPKTARRRSGWLGWGLAAGAILAGSLVICGMLVYGLSYLYSWPARNAAVSPTQQEVLNLAGDVTLAPLVATTPAPAILPSATQPVDTGTPTASPTVTPLSVQAILPPSQLAFVSAVGASEQLDVLDIPGGSVALLARDGHAGFDPGAGQVLDAPQQVPTSPDYSGAWWPDWCDGNSQIVFESHYSSGEQSIASTDLQGQEMQVRISGEDSTKLGVPRCTYGLNSGSLGALLYSAQMPDNPRRWGLFYYSFDSSQSPEQVGSQYLLAGNASWSSDNQWAAFMGQMPAKDTQRQQAFHLVRLSGEAGNWTTSEIAIPQSRSEKYPAVSPVNGEIAFACLPKNEQSWSLCVVGADGHGFARLVGGIAPENGSRTEVTPAWSADGRWIAFAGVMDGEWDIYLYSLEHQVTINVTDQLPGDQFQPGWSKP
jgi:eukaryotic-like serine/threonine-protein kinase